MDAASAQAEARRLTAIVQEKRTALGFHRRDLKRAAEKLRRFEEKCRQFDIELTVKNAHEAPKGAHGGTHRDIDRH